MHLFFRLNAIAVLLFTHTLAFADSLANPIEARQLADRVMAKIGAGEIEAGLLLTKPFLLVPTPEFDVMREQLKMQLPAMSLRFGKSVGTEFIREEKAGENLLRLTYVHRFEKHPMRWVFYFYRGKGGWMLNTFKTDDDIRQLFAQY